MQVCVCVCVCVYLHPSSGRKTKWCRNAGQRKGELQDWGMGRFSGGRREEFKRGAGWIHVAPPSAESILFVLVSFLSEG